MSNICLFFLVWEHMDILNVYRCCQQLPIFGEENLFLGSGAEVNIPGVMEHLSVGQGVEDRTAARSRASQGLFLFLLLMFSPIHVGVWRELAYETELVIFKSSMLVLTYGRQGTWTHGLFPQDTCTGSQVYGSEPVHISTTGIM